MYEMLGNNGKVVSRPSKKQILTVMLQNWKKNKKTHMSNIPLQTYVT